MSSTGRGLVALVALLAVAGIGVAASGGSITAAPSDPGATATHTVTVSAGNASAGSWNGLGIDYAAAGADASNVGASDVRTIGIDYGDDEAGAAIDANASSDLSSVQVSNEGTYLVVQLGGSYGLNATDEVVLVVEGVVNPSDPGTYDVPLDVNPQSSGGQTTATLEIGAATTTATESVTPSTHESATETATETATATATGTETATQQNGGGGLPGFTVGAAAAAVLGAALLATRRR